MKKRFYFIGIMLFLGAFVQANAQRESQSVRTIFNSMKFERVSGFGGSTVTFTKINNDFTILSGGCGGVVLNNMFIGAYGEGTSYSEPVNTHSLPSFNHGGFILGYEYQYQKMIHPVVSSRIGWGTIASYSSELGHRFNDQVFVFVPTLSAEINFTRFFKLNLGAEYRLVANVDGKTGYHSSDFSNAGIFASFIFGWF